MIRFVRQRAHAAPILIAIAWGSPLAERLA